MRKVIVKKIKVRKIDVTGRKKPFFTFQGLVAVTVVIAVLIIISFLVTIH